MKALRLLEWKHQPELVEVPEPHAGPGEAVIEIAGSGACHSDLHLMHDFDEGLLPWGPPFTLGHENAGWIRALGPGVDGLSVGDPVAVYGPWGCGRCRRCRLGMENYCERQALLGPAGGGLGRDGGMAQFMLVPHARWLVPLGDLDPITAAPLTDAGLTPYHAIKRSLPLLVPGSTAVVIGAGGLGHMAIQILRELAPSAIVAVDVNDNALEAATKSGADHIVRAGEDAADAIKDLTHGTGAELVLDMVGTDSTLGLAGSVVRQLGHLTIVGLAGGSLPISFFSVGYEVSVATTYWGTLPELHEVIALAAAGRIRARTTTYPLDDAMSAYEAMRTGRLDGRAVIVPTPPTSMRERSTPSRRRRA